MIKITIPNNNTLERKYIIDVIFDEFLGLKYQIIESERCQNWEIEIENGFKIIFEDHFFNKFIKELDYLRGENIPSKIEFITNEFLLENNLVIIYGNDKLEVLENKIICGLDIFASSFFMLTRWEEYVNKNRDNHNRFLAIESLSFKNDFLDRPIVNEYLEMLKKMLSKFDNSLMFKQYKYELMLTHDVDSPERYNTLKSRVLEFINCLLKQKSLTALFKSLNRQIKVFLGKEKDPFDTFDYLMDVSEKLGLKSYFFFMGQGTSKYDNKYKSSDKFIKNLIEKIKHRGHNIGIHPTYNAYNNIEQFRKEKKELEQNLVTKITFGREHYLRFEVPTTWQIWEDNNMTWDSTCSYADREGFRCGICYEYSVFNILTRKKLNLKERPLIVMEGSFATYQSDIIPEKMETKIKDLMNSVKKYNGTFVFLWHNSSFNTMKWIKYHDIYEKVLK